MITYENKNALPGTLRSAITYETKSRHPGELPFATIHMDGLLCFCFDHANKCTIAVNNRVGNEHKWKFSIVDLEPGKLSRRRVWKQEDFPNFSEVNIEVQGGTTHGTYVYDGSSVSIPSSDNHRYNLETHWLDLEGERGHNQRVENNTDTLWPRFNINEGLFCASRLSRLPYALKDSNPIPHIKPLGQIAVRIVADIFLDTSNPDSKIVVRLPRETAILDNTKRYNIFISNNCDSTVGDNTDFHLHYKAFSNAFRSSNGMKVRDQFHLVRDIALLEKVKTKRILAPPEINYYNDKAPCMGVVLGQTRAFK